MKAGCLNNSYIKAFLLRGLVLNAIIAPVALFLFISVIIAPGPPFHPLILTMLAQPTALLLLLVLIGNNIILTRRFYVAAKDRKMYLSMAIVMGILCVIAIIELLAFIDIIAKDFDRFSWLYSYYATCVFNPSSNPELCG